MTDDRTPPEDGPSLAAEYALGILDREERARARRLAATDPSFRAEVERWLGRLGPMLDEIEPVSPPTGLWARIEQATAGASAGANVYRLERRLTLWRGVAAAMTAIAASLALIVLLRSPVAVPVATPPQVASAPMVARLASDQQVAVVASWDSQRRQLLLASAAGLPLQAQRSHELWVIPADGKPRSLGVMPEAKQSVVRLPSGVSRLMLAGATIAVSVEPRGGSPTGAPTGPVVASGTLEAA